jgi:tryptophan-rich hypothetical protein
MKGRRKIRHPHLLGSKWTATQSVLGWRHFQVIGREDREGLVFAHLQSVCDSTVHLWVNACLLRDRDLWEAGWTPLAQLRASEAIDETTDVRAAQ